MTPGFGHARDGRFLIWSRNWRGAFRLCLCLILNQARPACRFIEENSIYLAAATGRRTCAPGYVNSHVLDAGHKARQ